MQGIHLMIEKKILSARSQASFLMDMILGEQRLLSEINLSSVMKNLSTSDRARSQRLLLNALRSLERADALLLPLLKKRPNLKIFNILRLATVEIMDNGDAHGIVNEYVSIVGMQKRLQNYKGLVNAVLRKVAASEQSTWNNMKIPQLPKWLRRMLLKSYGSSIVEKIEKQHLERPPVDITLKNPALLKYFCNELKGTEIFKHSLRLKNAGQLSKLTGFNEGDWWVQDLSASIPVLLVEEIKGKSALDLCAAPGGKTMQMAAAGARVTAVDISEMRSSKLKENLTRTSLEAKIVISDLFEIKNFFDVIILDAPCSATGTIRRHPDLPYAKSGVGLNKLFSMQYKMLQHAVSLMKPNSQLIYCTCSLLPQEGEHQVHKLLSNFRELRVDKYLPKDLVFLEEYRTHEGGLRLLPNHFAETGGTDGFYIAKLVKV